jgi:adenylate cyclase class 2
MGYEVEIKFRVTNHEDVTARLRALGAREGPEHVQADAYLAHPARDFAQTGEAFRIRSDGSCVALTYKGPKHAGPTKTREEIEIPLAGGPESLDEAERLFVRLGFRRVAVIRKRRRPFHLTYLGRSLEVALDEAEGLGTFAEVEALAVDPADLSATQAAVQALAGALALTEVEPRSYLRMGLERMKEDRNRSGPT